MSFIPAALREEIIKRANGKCEYCLMDQKFSLYNHEIDHIMAIKHGGKTTASNLALACLSCNRHKGSDFATIDLKTGEIITLFNPRQQQWIEHFTINDARIDGLTKIGQATTRLLKFNTSRRCLERQILIRQGQYL